jgi:hypothetical protein
MQRVRLLVALLAIVAVSVVLPATATSSGTTYTLAGVEVDPSPATFVGTVTNGFGTWKAVVLHDPLSYTGTTTITGGSFTITTILPAGQAIGTIDGGKITAGPVTPVDGFGCTQTFTLLGTLNSGTGRYAGVLTHYGFLFGGRCNALAASFRGQATI